MELMGKVKSIFSIHGEYSRLQYLIYGVITPIIIVSVGYFIPTTLEVMILVALYIFFISMIKST